MDIDNDGCHDCRFLFYNETTEILNNINYKDLLKGSFYRLDKLLTINDDLIFQSNDLDEVIEHLKLLKITNKYNL